MAKIKICGITNREDYDLAVKHGADFTGFIFYGGSPRFVNAQEAKEIISNGKKGAHMKVGVFVHENQQMIREIFRYTGLDLVQLHGEESPEYCQELDLPYWKVIRVKDHLSLMQLSEWPGKTFVLDTFSKTMRGGTGQVFRLELAREAIAGGKNIIVAGGISINNLPAILSISPYAIDVSSSLELRPGKKCPEKMGKFFTQFRSRG